MNRGTITGVTGGTAVPRTRGDEPEMLQQMYGMDGLFPAHAGMNRLRISRKKGVFTVPRTRGDEPPLILRLS